MRVVNVYAIKRFTQLPHGAVFVFGSNTSGRHGKGAAKDAKDFFGAIYGQGAGMQGNAYAIPTKDERLNILPLSVIETYVKEFIVFAKHNPTLTFLITPIGTGLSLYKEAQIAPLFETIPENCIIPLTWIHYYHDTAGLTSLF